MQGLHKQTLPFLYAKNEIYPPQVPGNHRVTIFYMFIFEKVFTAEHFYNHLNLPLRYFPLNSCLLKFCLRKIVNTVAQSFKWF